MKLPSHLVTDFVFNYNKYQMYIHRNNINIHMYTIFLIPIF